MATLAAARADNMYYPPEWRPEYGGISKFQGSNGHNQYEKYGKIRFELPVHGWCLGCGRHIGRGTRFNATKDQAGTYYSTKIWQFSMKCPSCSTVMIIKTDPKNTDYEYVEGIRKKDMAFDPEEAETQRVQDSEVSNKLAVDPLYRLEHEQADKRRAASRKTVLTRLTELADSHARDDYSSNARLRQGMRGRKRKEKEREEEATAKGLRIRLATPSPADAVAARGVKYRSRHKSFRAGEKAKMAAITSESIFGSGKETGEQARRKAVLVKAAKLGLKTRGMRLLEEPGGGGDGGGRAAKRRRSHVSGEGAFRSRGSPTQERIACKTGTRKRPRLAGSGREGGGVRMAEAVMVNGDCAVRDEGGMLESGGGGGFGGGDADAGGGGGESPKARSAEVARGCSRKENGSAATKPKKKRRKASSGGGAAAGNGGLAVIASLY